MAQRLKIPGVLHTRAAFEPSTFDEKKGTVEVIFTTGARGLRRSWDGTYYEELEVSESAVDLSRLNNGAPYLDDHNRWQGVRAVLGVVERAWIQGKEGRAVIRFSDREDVKPIKADVQNGILRHVSVGYSIQKYEKIEEVEGVPVYRATKWTPAEISQTPIAFDDGAVVRGARQQQELQAFTEVEISTRNEEQSMDPKQTPGSGSAPAAPAVAAPPVAPVSTTQPSSTDDATRAAREEAVRTERARVASIQGLVARHKLGDDFARKLIEDGTEVEKARTLILDALAERSAALPPSPGAHHQAPITAGEDAREKFVRGASAWLFERAGLVGELQRAAKLDEVRFGKLTFDPGEFRGLNLVELARESLERNGVKTRGMSRMDLVGMAFTHRSGGQSTSDFAVLFENVMHKTVLGAYALQPDTWSLFCKADTVPDFRPSNRFRTGSFGALDSLTEQGEFKNKVIPDGQKTSISTGTKGNIIALTRQAIVNDDMSALADLAQKLGRAARLSVEVDVYGLLNQNGGLGPTMADANPFFHASRGNVNATGAALTVDALEKDRVVMAQQKDISANEYLDLRPAVLVVPTGLGGEARVLNDAQFDPTDNKFQKPNKVRGLFRTVVDTPRLSGNRRYLFADPSVAPAIVVAFLEGQGQAPVLESEDGWRIDGVEWKVRFDFKAQPFDPKGAVTNAGQ